MKRKLLFLMALLVSSTMAWADDYFYVDAQGVGYNKTSETEVEVGGDTRDVTRSITIPATVTIEDKVYNVTSIATEAFKGDNYIPSVIIGENVTSIGANAFERCYFLSSVTIPSSVTIINNSAFHACTYLSSVIFDGESQLETIGESAFYVCTSLTSITIPASVTSIGMNAFSASALTSITIPAGVTSIGMNAFAQCESLANVTFDTGSDLSIGSQAFMYCSLSSIHIPARVTVVEPGAFSINNLTSITVANENTVYNDGDGSNAIIHTESNTLVEGCQNTVIPNTVTSIGAMAFAGVMGISFITIPERVTSIGQLAFAQCSNLTSVTIPASITEIGSVAFYGCPLLSSVTIWNTSVPTLGGIYYDMGVFAGCADGLKIYVPTEAAATAYKAAENWSAYGSNIEAMGNTLTANLANGSYWATYYNSNRNADVDANTKVYTVSVSGSNATLHEIADGNIKAGQGVVLKSTASTISLTYNTTETTGDFSTNVLEGVDAATACEANANYTLANESGLGFYKYTGTTLGANKAYLPGSVVSAGARAVLFQFEETTSVDDVRVKNEEFAPAVYYNLKGQRVEKPTKGLYIKNGKKYIVK